MSIKYKLNYRVLCVLGKFLGIVLLMLISNGVNAQISGGELEPEKEKDKKEKKYPRQKEPFNSDSLSGGQFYFTGFVQHAFRDFEDQSVFNKHELLNDEEPVTAGGGSVGYIIPMAGNISLDAGLSVFTHGEAYNYSDPITDSTFSYTNTYIQVGVPLRLRYTHGKDFQFFGFAGIMPLNIINIRYNETYKTEEGNTIERDTDVIKDGFTPFNIMFSGGLGINYFFSQWGITIYPEYRRHLMNTYADDTFKRVHKMYGFALNFGLQYRL